MYNHIITCTHDQNEYEAICESSPYGNNEILFWPTEFGLPNEEKEILEKELAEWAKSQGIRPLIIQGKRC